MVGQGAVSRVPSLDHRSVLPAQGALVPVWAVVKGAALWYGRGGEGEAGEMNRWYPDINTGRGVEKR